MPLIITWGDYDTVCYSNQHNIIQLIQHSISIGDTINSITATIQDILDKIANGGSDQDIHDLQLLVENLNVRLSAVERQLSALINGTPDAMSFPIWEKITDLENRILSLGG